MIQEKLGVGPNPPQYVQPYLQTLNPNEIHNAGGHCFNPKCDYVFTPEDEKEIQAMDGWFTCPKCDSTYNVYTQGNRDSPGGFTHSGLTMSEMGQIGETIINRMVNIPGVGTVTWWGQGLQGSLDFVIGVYGVELKTNHSEAQPRFKLGGAYEVAQKKKAAIDAGLTPAMIGVRLNFYTDNADIFFRPAMIDTWIGNPLLQHIAKVDFTEFNPYKHPEDVPTARSLPDDDSTPAPDSDIPF
jgi:hypothetical protein